MNKVKIFVYDTDYSFIKYLVSNNIFYDELCYDNGYYLNVLYDSYKKISRRYKCRIVKYYGKVNVKLFLIKNKYFFISFIFCFFLFNLLLNTIFEVRVNVEEELVDEIYDILNEYEITKYKRVKSYDELLLIKEIILEKYSSLIKWLEITRKGTLYIVDVTPKIVFNKSDESSGCFDVVAKRDGLIKHISSTKGVKLKFVNDYVKSGDVLISGSVYKGEDLYSDGGSEGRIFAETWYTVSSSIPYEYTNYVPTSDLVNRYYIKVFDTQITLTGHYRNINTISKHKLILEKPYLFFKLYKEEMRKYIYKTVTLSHDEAFELALKRSEEEINKMLDEEEYVISKKVLKKDEKSSKMYVEVFFKVFENIGVTSNRNCLGESNEVSD